MALQALALTLGFAVSVLSGFLGIGGGIIMAPALLYLPPTLGLGTFDMQQVTGLTITQGLFACLSGALRHDRYRCVNRRLVVWMGGALGASALAGSVVSGRVAADTLMIVFAALAVAAAVLMCLQQGDDPNEATGGEGGAVGFSVPLAVSLGLGVGFLCGMVGQGGSFILVPLMLYLLRLPTRLVIGSNLALVFLSSLAGFAGKAITGQIPLLPALPLAAGAIPGAQVGGALSQQSTPRRLRVYLAAVIAAAALVVAGDAISNP
jgi:hypothetical protein